MDLVRCPECGKKVLDALICVECGARLGIVMIRLGTIAGRHPLPVDEYLLTEEIEPGDPAYEAAYRAALDWAKAHHGEVQVKLYYTGLTEVTLGVLDGLATGGLLDQQLTLMRFDVGSKQYVPLKRRHFRMLGFLLGLLNR